MEYTWWMLSFACLGFAKCLSGASAAAVNIDFYSSSSQPSDVNIYNLQDVKKEDSAALSESSDPKTPNPSANIVASYVKGVSYPIKTVIKDWSTSDSHSHLEGGMKYEDGKLIVPKSGRYYIYAQLHFQSAGRVQILVNDDFVSLITSPVTQKGKAATVNGIGVFVLNAGDTISLRINPWGAPNDGSVKFWMDYHHCYFGAFLI